MPKRVRNWVKIRVNQILPAKEKNLNKNKVKKIKQALMDDMINLNRKYSVDISKWGF